MSSTHSIDLRSRPPAASGRLLRTAPAAALVWSLSTGALGALWTVSDLAYPWGEGRVGLMASLDRPLAGWVLVGLAALALTSLAAARARRRSIGPDFSHWPNRLLLGLGVLVTVLIADASGLALLGYLPMILGSLVLGSVPDLQVSNLWSSFVSLSNTLGGVALFMAGTAIRRSVLQACARCGRVPARRRAVGERAVQRWAIAAVAVATMAPLAYAVTRIAWFFGVPLGIDPEMLEDLGDARWAGLGLAAGATAGAALTIGLVSRWGEVFPRWVPWLGGRPVPVGVAVVPAVVVAAAVTSAGTSFILTLFSQEFGNLPGTAADWGAWLPTTLWPLWGVSLFTAAMAYRLRRRAPCPACGAGEGQELDEHTAEAGQ